MRGWALLVLAAAAYVAGGIAMKYSNGFRHGLPSALVFVAFGTGAALQTLAMREGDLSVAYVLVLGLEAILAVIAGRLLFQEAIPLKSALGIVVVIVGMLLIKSPG
jgi:multidrug transporter EmrE-like cation transporter